jgi:hypothetical protein
MQLGMIGLGRMGANMVRRLGRAGHDCVVPGSLGDVVFQPRKVERSGLGRAVDGVLIYVHKERELDDVERRYPADHYVLVDDKLRVLTVVKRSWGARATNPAAALTVERIGDLVGHDLSTARARAAAAAS